MDIYDHAIWVAKEVAKKEPHIDIYDEALEIVLDQLQSSYWPEWPTPSAIKREERRLKDRLAKPRLVKVKSPSIVPNQEVKIKADVNG